MRGIADGAHRGLTDGTYNGRRPVEDTVQSALRAVAAGARMVEVDFQETARGGCVVNHDPTTGRTAYQHRNYVIRNRTQDFFANHALLNNRVDHIPTCSYFLSRLAPYRSKVQLEYEIKTLNPSSAHLHYVAHLIAALGFRDPGAARVESFRPANLERYRHDDQKTPCDFISTGSIGPSVVEKVGCQGAIIPFAKLVEAMKSYPPYASSYASHGLRLDPWEVNTRTDQYYIVRNSTMPLDPATGVPDNSIGLSAFISDHVEIYRSF